MLLKQVHSARERSQQSPENIVFCFGSALPLLEHNDVFCRFSQDGGLVEFCSLGDSICILRLVVLVLVLFVLGLDIAQRWHDILEVIDTVVDVVAISTLDGIVSDLLLLLCRLRTLRCGWGRWRCYKGLGRLETRDGDLLLEVRLPWLRRCGCHLLRSIQARDH